MLVRLMSSNEETAARPRISSRDREVQRDQLRVWLAERLGDARAQVSPLVVPPTNGMSSETLLFDASWDEAGARQTRAYVARVAPDPTALPVFPTYDMEGQFRIMRLIAAVTTVPVPVTVWYEPDTKALGAPFFVMERVDGRVPPDLMPYTFGDNWLFDADQTEQQRLQAASVGIVAKIHEIGPDGPASFLTLDAPGDTHLRRHVNSQRAYYEWIVAGAERIPLIERAVAWLEDHWPAHVSADALSWGDARIGNIIYRDFEPVAVLDWEMAAIGPPEIDLGWMIFLHRFFQDLTEQAGLVGMPGFLRRDDVASAYEAITGRSPRDLDFYTVYAALRHAIIMARIAGRSIHFGEAIEPDDPDDLILHRPTLEAMVEGTYWRDIGGNRTR
ncbi:MAG TPA: phosphotransferase family protein [Acidimicrobiales bacterium]|nr:phosphotransferase family protein [Acidimicrobiales bacterium]